MTKILLVFSVLLALFSPLSHAALSIQQPSLSTDQFLCGNSILTDFRSMKVLYARGMSSGFTYSTFRANGATSGYSVPNGYKLVCRCAQVSGQATTNATGINLGSGTSDVGPGSLAAPAGAEKVFSRDVAIAASSFTAIDAVAVFPAGRYPYVETPGITSGGVEMNLYCYEVTL